METYYPVSYNGKTCGKVTVSRKGLYYHFHCRCILENDEIYRLFFLNGNQQQSLGILVPLEDAFTLKTSCPVKNLRDGEWLFQVFPQFRHNTGNFIPIHPEEPFAYISRLKESFLIYHNGQPGIMRTKLQE